MLSQCRDRAHYRFDMLHSDWWNKGAYRTDRGVHLAPALARGQLWMLQVLSYRVHPCVGDVRSLESSPDFGGWQVREHALDRGGERVAMLHPKHVPL